MSHLGWATNDAANNEWREVLARIKEGIQALVEDKKAGVTADECSSLRTLGWTLAVLGGCLLSGLREDGRSKDDV